MRPIIILLMVSLTACTSIPRKQCYEMNISLGKQVICTTVPQTESKLMRRI